MRHGKGLSPFSSPFSPFKKPFNQSDALMVLSPQGLLKYIFIRSTEFLYIKTNETMGKV